MKIVDWFLKQFNKDNIATADIVLEELTTEVFYKELAINACINLIADTISNGEFITYEKGKEVKNNKYYLFNVEPNQNKAANKFWREVIYKLLRENRCLVVQRNGMFYMAESYGIDEYALLENVYKNVVVENLQLNGTFKESEVFHFEMNDRKIKTIIDGLYKTYSKLIAASQAHYKKNNARRGALEIPTDYPQTDTAQEEIQNLLQKKFKRFFEAEGGAVIPLTNGMKYEELSSNIGVKGGAEGRDIRAFIDDVIDMTAIGFGIPPQLLKGNVADTEKAVDNFLTFCISPKARFVTNEINRKMYGRAAFLENTYTKLDVTRIRAVNIKDVANALDVLVRIGAYNIDDCLKQLGMEPLNTEWSQARYMTKNYERIGKGGENNGDGKNKNQSNR